MGRGDICGRRPLHFQHLPRDFFGTFPKNRINILNSQHTIDSLLRGGKYNRQLTQSGEIQQTALLGGANTTFSDPFRTPFELQTPDFAWKFIWTIWTKGIHPKKNLHGTHARKIPWTMEIAITQPFFEPETQDFAWNFVWTIQNSKVRIFKPHGNVKHGCDLY